jgi:hypothetical protein
LKALEYRMLRRVCGPKREEVMHNGGLLQPNIIKVIRSRRMRLVGHVTRMGEMRNA